jgi:hypothetical protein
MTAEPRFSMILSKISELNVILLYLAEFIAGYMLFFTIIFTEF